MTISRLAAVAATIALAVAAAGCGGSSNSASETEQWADGMCSALVDWQNSVTAAGEKVSKGDLSKSALQGAANGVSDANKQLRDDLDSLGKPPTETADKAKEDLTQLTDDLKTNLDKIREALGSAGNDVTSAITAVSGSVQAMSQDLQNTSTQLKALESDDTWSKAFKSSDSCQKLSG
jgi:small-conductance mechanosensitive channel